MKADFSTRGLVKRRVARLAMLLAAAMCMGSMPSWCCEEAASGGTLHQAKQNLEVPATIGIYFLSPSSAPAGTVVDVRGYGFSATPSDNQVAFNGHHAIVLSSGTNSIRTIVPAIADSGPVTITNSNGTAVSSQSFTVLAPSSR
jgi:IPT/TIG domain-containing protein